MGVFEGSIVGAALDAISPKKARTSRMAELARSAFIYQEGHVTPEPEVGDIRHDQIRGADELDVEPRLQRSPPRAARPSVQLSSKLLKPPGDILAVIVDEPRGRRPHLPIDLRIGAVLPDVEWATSAHLER